MKSFLPKCMYCPKHHTEYHCQKCGTDFCNDCFNDHIQVFPEHEIVSNNIGADIEI